MSHSNEGAERPEEGRRPDGTTEHGHRTTDAARTVGALPTADARDAEARPTADAAPLADPPPTAEQPLAAGALPTVNASLTAVQPRIAVELRGLTVAYAGRPVVEDLDLRINAGETVAILGPSGSGKSTVLAAIAGFVAPTAGEVRVDDEVVATPARQLPPERRRVGVVFQDNALWPHMSALETVAYPLRRQGIPRATAEVRALDMLRSLGIESLAARRPAELSGGEQQRVGLGRALLRDAAVYLFDEPTAHLDAAMRPLLQEQLVAQRSGRAIATLLATHDVAEAFAIADRVALLREGRLVQLGTPVDVYERPVDRWAAALTGHAAVLEGTLLRIGGGRAELEFAGLRVDVAVDGATVPPGLVDVLVRPDWCRLDGSLPGTVERVAYRGGATDYSVATPAGRVHVRCPGPPARANGDEVRWTPERAWLLPRSRVAPAHTP